MSPAMRNNGTQSATRNALLACLDGKCASTAVKRKWQSICREVKKRMIHTRADIRSDEETTGRAVSTNDESATQSAISIFISSRSILPLVLCFANTKIDSGWIVCQVGRARTHAYPRNKVRRGEMRTFSSHCWLPVGCWLNGGTDFHFFAPRVRTALRSSLHARHLDNGFARVLDIKSMSRMGNVQKVNVTVTLFHPEWT